MYKQTHIEPMPNRGGRNQEMARGILGIGLLAAGLCGALALLRRRKALFLRPLMVIVFLVLTVALLGTVLGTFRRQRFNRH